ncbi:MAG: AMP-binding protein, partial [Blastocatellia bacterium]|nr:AMP-binding protein [Blastocatellia bacterium]
MGNQVVSGYRLSPQQKYVWNQQAGTSFFVNQIAFFIDGKIETRILNKTLQEIIARHEIFRTRLIVPPGMTLPIQSVSDEPLFDFAIRENAVQADSQMEFARALLSDEAQFRCDVAVGPVVRACLAPVGVDAGFLVITVPSILCDSRTLLLLAQEIITVYQQVQTVTPDENEQVQFVQFSEWQNELNESTEAQVGREFWQNISPVSEPLQLPFEKQKITLGACNWIPVELPEPFPLVAEVSPQTLFLAVLGAFVQRLTNAPEFEIGCLFDRRKFPELESVAGLLAASLPVRFQIGPDVTLASLCREIGQTLQEYADWEEFFSPDLLPETETKPFPIEFEFQETFPMQGREFSLTPLICRNVSQPFRLKCSVFRSGETFRLELGFPEHLFEVGFIGSLGRSLATFVKAAAEHPNAPLATLPLLHPDDERFLLAEVNQTQTELPPTTIVSLILDQMAETPDAVAVWSDEHHITYAELNQMASRIALHLVELGVTTEVPVAVFCQRSVELVAGILGIMQAGGCFVPLDPDTPVERLRTLLGIVQPRAILTQTSMRVRLPETSIPILCREDFLSPQSSALSPDFGLSPQSAVRSPDFGLSPESAAYVLFTSGSTGTPKGVVVEHRSLLNYLLWCR